MPTRYLFVGAPPFTPPPSMLDTVRRLWKFALRPEPVQREHNVMEVKFPLLLQILLVHVMVLTLVALLLSLIYTNMGIQLQGRQQPWTSVAEQPFLVLFVSLILIAPIKEEIVFRMPMVYSTGFVVVALAVFLFHYGPMLVLLAGLNLQQALALLAVIVLVAVVCCSQESLRSLARRVWQNHFGLVFYAFTILFALMHLLNYYGLSLPHYLLPLLVLPQLIGGIFLGYTRLRLGLAWAIGQHMFNNALILFLIYGYMATN